jgi:hypothetical protein
VAEKSICARQQDLPERIFRWISLQGLISSAPPWGILGIGLRTEFGNR